MEIQPTIPTPAGQPPCAISGDAPCRNWGRILTHHLGGGRHSLDLFGIRAPVGSHRDPQQIHPNWQVARDPVGRSLVTQHQHVRRLGRVAPDLSRSPSRCRWSLRISRAFREGLVVAVLEP